MKRKAEDSYDRNNVNDILRSQDERGRNGAINRSGNNLDQSDHRKRTGRLFVSPLKRLEQAGKLGWGNIQSLNQSTVSDDISKRRIVKLKLPSELLQERSLILEERSPEKMEIMDSNILDSNQNLESTTINDQNITSTSFSVFKNTTTPPIGQTQIAPSSTTTTTGFGLFNTQKEIQLPILPQVEVQTIQPVQPTTSIFGSSLQTQNQEEKPSSSIFPSQSNTPQPTSLFASSGTSLFGNKTTNIADTITPAAEVVEPQVEKPKEETEAPKAGGLFGNLSGITGNKPLSGLFNIASTPTAVIEKKESIQEETKIQSTGGLQLNIDKTKLFGAAVPSPQGSQSKSLFSSNIKTDNGFPKAGLFGNMMENKSPASIFGGNAKPPTTTEIVPEKTQQVQEQPKGLFGNLSGNQQKAETTPQTGGLFGSQAKTEMVAETPAEKPKTSIFGNLVSYSQPATGGFFGNSLLNQQKATESTQGQTEKPKEGLFSGMVSSQPKTDIPAEKPKGGLFSGMATSQPKTEATSMTVETQAEKPKGGLFGSMLSKTETTSAPVQPSTGGFFNNQQKAPAETTQVPAEKPKGGLFSGMVSSQPKTDMTVETPAEKPKGGLFSGMATSQLKTEPVANQAKPTEPTPTQAEKPTGGLFGSSGSVTTSQPKNDSPKRSIQPSSLGSFGHAPATQQKKENTSPPKPSTENTETKSAVKPEGTKPGLFSGMASSKPASFVGSVNQNIGKTEDSNNQEGGKPGLFANVLVNKPSEGGAKPGLFSGLAPKPFAGFGSNTSEQKDAASSGGLKLGQLGAAKGGLFSGTPAGNFASLFGGGANKSSGLFGKPATGGDEAKDDEGSDIDDEEGDDDPERSPSPEADVSKSRGNYQYQQDYDKIISKKVNKFKPGQKNMLQEGEISLNKKGENTYFIIYRNKAKLVQYQGQLIPQFIKTEFLNPRKDALSVVSFSEDKGEEGAEESKGKSKLAKDILKVMFGAPEDCEQFKNQLDKLAK